MISNLKRKIAGFQGTIQKNENSKELLLESAIAFVIRVGGAVFSFLMNVVAARYLGVKESGDFFLTLAIITIVATVVRIGGDNAVIRFVGIHAAKKEWTQVRGVLKQLFFYVVIFSISLTALLMVSSSFIAKQIFNKPSIENTLIWMFLAIPAYALYTLYAMGLQGLKKLMFSVTLQNIAVPLLLIILIIIFSPVDSLALAKLYCIASVATLIIAYFIWKYFVPAGDAHFDKSVLWKSCMPLWIMALLQQSIQWGGQFIAGIFSDSAHLAQLAAAQRTSMLISFIGIAINLVSAPKFALLYNQGRKAELKNYAVTTTRLMVLFSTPLIVLVWCMPQYIMSLFGKDFTGGYWMLRILALGQFINVITGSVGYLLMMSGHEKDMRNITFISGFLSIVLNIVLIKYFNALGAAIAIAIAIATQNLLAVNMVKKRLGFSTLAFYRK